MANYDFTQNGNQLVVTLDVSGNDAEPRITTYFSPSLDFAVNRIRMFEAGQYKQAFLFTDIGTIAGETPTDLQDAAEKINDIIANFNSGGDTPSLGYKEYVAFISQTDMDNPVLQELKNDTGAVITSVRITTGLYVISSDIDAFIDGKTIPANNNAEMILSNVLVSSEGVVSGSYIYYRGSASEITLRTFDASDTPSDSVLDGTQMIRIQIFD